MDMDPTTLGDGTTLHAPSDDEDPPALPPVTRALHPPFGSNESSSDSEGGPSRFHILSVGRSAIGFSVAPRLCVLQGPRNWDVAPSMLNASNELAEVPLRMLLRPNGLARISKKLEMRGMMNFAKVAGRPWWPLLFAAERGCPLFM